jgi:chemotaxis protein MotB
MKGQVMVLALLLAGCGVSKKKYEAMEAQYRAEAEKATQLQQQLTASSGEAAALATKAAQLQASMEEMERGLTELRSREAEAEAEVAAYKDLLARFKEMIDAGTLRVKIVDGRMVVELATDILFGSGSADLSAPGKEALGQVATVLAAIPERDFQVEGHTDNAPIKTKQYPSNWELAAARAITVVRALETGGLPPERVSAASFAFHKPAAPNDTPEGKASNRRIEIVVLPDLSGLPAFQELNDLASKP